MEINWKFHHRYLYYVLIKVAPHIRYFFSGYLGLVQVQKYSFIINIMTIFGIENAHVEKTNEKKIVRILNKFIKNIYIRKKPMVSVVILICNYLRFLHL